MKKIYLSEGTGKGNTEMLAYCKALKEAGIDNMNIIRLSSVLPHNSIVIKDKPPISFENYGNKLYAVISEIRESRQGKTACAGLGYAYHKKKTGHGLMVEISGDNEEKIKKDIRKTLNEFLCENNYDLNNMEIHTKSIKCENEPVCALIAMSFEIEKWEEI
jgi:arginine decarboxylase